MDWKFNKFNHFNSEKYGKDTTTDSDRYESEKQLNRNVEGNGEKVEILDTTSEIIIPLHQKQLCYIYKALVLKNQGFHF